MKIWLMLPVLMLLSCSEELSSSSTSIRILPWESVSTVEFDSLDGATPLVELPTSEQRQALRLTANPGTCFQVTSAITPTGEELSNSFIRNPCPDCLWRTSNIQDSGLLVLEGNASQLHSIGFNQIDCQSHSPVAGTSQVTIEQLLSSQPVTPAIQLRLILTEALDIEKLIELTEEKLQLAVSAIAVEYINDANVTLVNNDLSDLQTLLDPLPEKEEGVIDVVIGLCLERDNHFSIQPLAGFTPRIPGGAGTADAVFVSRRTCKLDVESPNHINEITHITAHEIGHYLGLLHPEDSDGVLDDLTSTNTSNLMHREPLRLESTGLTEEQIDRMLAHPFVMEER